MDAEAAPRGSSSAPVSSKSTTPLFAVDVPL